MILDWGITKASQKLFDDELGGLVSIESDLKLATMAMVKVFNIEMVKELKAQFVAGTAPGGNRTGTAASANQLAQGYIPTIDTFRVDNQVPGMWSRIIMGGAASFIETGTPAHAISAVNGSALHFYWQAMDDAEVFFKSIWHPGYAGDRFVERAIERIELENFLAGIASSTFIRLFNPFGDIARPGGISLGGTQPLGAPLT